jgi:hypothetical protein
MPGDDLVQPADQVATERAHLGRAVIALEISAELADEGASEGGVIDAEDRLHNSDIRNMAAYNMLRPSPARWRWTQLEVVFYLALTQRLSSTSQFSDSRGVVPDALTLFRARPSAVQSRRSPSLRRASRLSA